MKKKLIYATLGLCLLLGFTTSVSAKWDQTLWSESNNYFKLYSSQNKVFAQTWDTINGGRMFLTSNGGTSWTQVASADNNTDILSLAFVNSNLLAGTWNGFYQSTTSGTSWAAITPTGLPVDSAISSVAMINGTLYAGSKGSIYKSSDNGTTWTEVKTGIPATARITSFVASGTSVIAGSDTSGVFITANSGTSWTTITSGLTDLHLTQLVVLGNKLFAVTLNGVFISTNNGTTWTAYSTGPKAVVNCFAVAKNLFIAGTDTSGAYLSSDSGLTWVSTGMYKHARVWSLTVTGDTIFAGTSIGIQRTTISTINMASSLKKSDSFRSAGSGLQYRKLSGSQASVSFTLSGSEMVNLDVYDMRGNKMQSCAQKKCAAGLQSIVFNTGSIAAGQYIIRLTAGATVYQLSVPILR